MFPFWYDLVFNWPLRLWVSFTIFVFCGLMYFLINHFLRPGIQIFENLFRLNIPYMFSWLSPMCKRATRQALCGKCEPLDILRLELEKRWTSRRSYEVCNYLRDWQQLLQVLYYSQFWFWLPNQERVQKAALSQGNPCPLCLLPSSCLLFILCIRMYKKGPQWGNIDYL